MAALSFCREQKRRRSGRGKRTSGAAKKSEGKRPGCKLTRGGPETTLRGSKR